MTTFTLNESYGYGYNMSPSAASGSSPIGPSDMTIHYVMSDDGSTIILDVSGAGIVDIVGMNYYLDGDYLFIEDIVFFDEDANAILTVDNWNLEVSVSALANGEYFSFEYTALSDIFNGTRWKDVIYSGPGADVVLGKGGNDRLSGDGGIDWLYGDSGKDSLYGGSGSDWLYGGANADALTGGANNDHFVYVSTAESKSGLSNHDTIMDFDDYGDDVIDFSGIYSGSLKWIGNHAFTGNHQVRIKDIAGSDVLVQVNLDSNKSTVEVEIVLHNTTAASMTSGDFVL